MNQKQDKHPLRFWLLLTVAMVIPIALLIVYRHNCQSEFDRRVAALAEKGYPVSLDDLEERYVLPEGAENAAEIYIEAFLSHQRPTGYETEFLPICGNYIWPDNAPPFPQKVMDVLESYIQRNQETLKLLDQAAKMEHCLWPRIHQGNYLSNDYFQDIKKAAQLLYERNLYWAQKGEPDKVFHSIQTAIALPSTLSKQPFLIDHLVSVALKSMAAGNLEDVLSMIQFTESQMEILQEQFAQMQDIYGFHNALVVDRCCTIEFWQLPPGEQAQWTFGKPSVPVRLLYSASGLKQKDALLSLDGMEKNIAASRLPLQRRDAALKEIENDINNGILSFMHLYLYELGGSVVTINQIDLRVMGNLKCAETALAIERYRRKHRSLPQSLDALVPQFMNELPRDPFDNKVLRYIKLDNGFTLYTIGEDGLDDGGLSRKQLKEKTGDNPKQYDWPFTVQW